MRAITAFFLTAALMCLGAAPAAEAAAHNAAPHVGTRGATEISSQQRRPRVRIYRSFDERGVFPKYFPGSNAVRDCRVNYVQELRASGTVIVPNMRCFWRQP